MGFSQPQRIATRPRQISKRSMGPPLERRRGRRHSFVGSAPRTFFGAVTKRSAVSLRIFRALFSTRGAKLSPMNQQQSNVLFAGMSAEEVAGVAAVALEAEPRLRTADRSQFLLRPCCLEDLLPLDHEARAVWEMVCSWDLTRFL